MKQLLREFSYDDKCCVRKQMFTNIIYSCSYVYKNSNITPNGN